MLVKHSIHRILLKIRQEIQRTEHGKQYGNGSIDLPFFRQLGDGEHDREKDQQIPRCAQEPGHAHGGGEVCEEIEQIGRVLLPCRRGHEAERGKLGDEIGNRQAHGH